MRKRSSLLCLAACLVIIAATGIAQTQSVDFNSISDVPSDTPVHGKYGHFQPREIKSHFNSLNSSFSANPAGMANVVSVPNFSSSFGALSKTWPYTMIGNKPASGGTTALPAHIAAVSLVLQNADLVTTTKVPVSSFVTPTLNSPNFRQSNFTSGTNVQYADAVQRAEFWHSMSQTWHTNLSPATVVDNIAVNIPRFVKMTLNGKPTEVRTYYTGKSSDGHTFVLVLDSFFNQAISNVVNNEINAKHYSTNAVNVALFPNTYLFSMNSSGGMGACCTLGFHTYFFGSSTPQPRWVFVYASWISPGIFKGGFDDVTALSHEISESLNDPFVNNLVPKWEFPGEPSVCQNSLEVGDPVEVLSDPTVSVPIKTGTGTFTYHPQTEAMLQWFEEIKPSNALNAAFSYPNAKALTGPAIHCQ